MHMFTYSETLHESFIMHIHIMYRICIVAHPAAPATNPALHTHNKQISACLREDVPEVNDQNLAGNTPLHYCFQCAWQDWSWKVVNRKRLGIPVSTVATSQNTLSLVGMTVEDIEIIEHEVQLPPSFRLSNLSWC